jgi:hypothetical protein
VSVQSFWPPVDAAQIDYETLRAHVLNHAGMPDDLAAARFGRRGLAGLITWPVSDPIFVAELRGAARPAWSPHSDPRLGALATGYQFLLDTAAALPRPITMTKGVR